MHCQDDENEGSNDEKLPALEENHEKGFYDGTVDFYSKFYDGNVDFHRKKDSDWPLIVLY